MKPLSFLRLILLLIFCTAFSAAAEKEEEEETAETLPPPVPHVLFTGAPGLLDSLFVAAASAPEIEIVNPPAFAETMRSRGLPALSGPGAASLFPDSGLVCVACPMENGRAFFSFYNASGGFLAGRLTGTPEEAVALIPAMTEKISREKKILFSVEHLTVPPELAPHRAAFLYEFASVLSSAPGILVREQSLLDFLPDASAARVSGEIRLDITIAILPETKKLQIACRARGARLKNAEAPPVLLPYPGPRGASAGWGTAAARAAASLAGVKLPSVSWNAQAEAERVLAFYRTSLSAPEEWGAARLPVWFGRLAPVLALLDSLAPGRREIRYERIFYNACALHESVSAQEKLRRLESCIQDIRDFNKREKDFSLGFDRRPECPVRPFEQLLISSNKAADQARFSALLAQLNAPEPEEDDAAEQLPPANPAPATWEELLRLHERIASTVRNAPRTDALRTVRLCSEAELRELTAVRNFKRKNPKAPLDSVSWGGYFPCDRQLSVFRRTEAWAEIKKILQESFDSYEKLCREIGTPKLSAHLAEVKMLRDYLLSGMSAEDLKAAFRGKLDPLFRQGFVLRPRMDLSGFLAGAVQAFPSKDAHEQLLKARLLLSYPYEYAFRNPSLSLKQKLLCLAEAGCGNPLWLAAEAGNIRAMAYDMIADRDANNTLSLLADTLYAKADVPDVRKALTALNAPFEIRETATPGVRTLAACSAAGKIFLLQENAARRMILTEYDPVSGVCRDGGMPDIPADEFQSARRFSGEKEPCSLSSRDGWLFAGGERMLLLRDMKSGRWFKVGDLEVPFPVCAGVHAGRVYCLCGGSPGPDGQDKTAALLTFLPDGTDRQVIFNGARNGMHALDALRKCRVSGFFTTPRGEWIFTAHSRNRYCRIYAFDPAKKSFRTVGSFPRDFEIFSFRLNGTALTGQGGAGFFRFRLSPPAPEWFFSQTAEDSLTIPNRIAGCMSLRMPALEACGLLISAGGLTPLAVNIKEPRKSPFLILPPSVEVFHVPSKHKLVFPAKNGRIYAVSAKFL